MFFNGPDNPQNGPFPWGISITSNTWFLSQNGTWQRNADVNRVLLPPHTGCACATWRVEIVLRQQCAPFNRFAGLPNATNRRTQRQTDRPRYSVCSNRSHLANAVMRIMRCKIQLIIKNKVNYSDENTSFVNYVDFYRDSEWSRIISSQVKSNDRLFETFCTNTCVAHVKYHDLSIVYTVSP